MNFLNRKQRFNLLNFIALLSIVRWYNILTIIIAQYFLAFFLFGASKSYLEILANGYLHLGIFSLGLITAGGFIINNFYDAEKDMVNRPKQTLFERLVRKNFVLNAYLIFNIVGFTITYLISKQFFAFSLLMAFFLWFYSHKLKKKVVLGTISAAFLGVFPLLAMPIFYREYEFVFYVYFGFFFMFNLIRQIVKDMLELKGDVIYGYNTIPVYMGLKHTKTLLFWLMIFASVPLFSILGIKGISVLSVYFFVAALIMIYSAIRIKSGKSKSVVVEVNNIYKVLLVTTVLSIFLLKM